MNLKSQRVSYLRALAINTLIKEAVQIFVENENTHGWKYICERKMNNMDI